MQLETRVYYLLQLWENGEALPAAATADLAHVTRSLTGTKL